jgi:primase-polymerase (primpol)-like protein
VNSNPPPHTPRNPIRQQATQREREQASHHHSHKQLYSRALVKTIKLNSLMDEDYHNSLLLYQQHQQLSLLNASNNNANTPGTSTATAENNQQGQGQQLSKYAQLLQVLEEMGELVVNYSSLNN